MLAALLFLVGIVYASNTTYIVVFDDAMALADLDDHISSFLGDVEPKHVYQHAIKGFAAELSAEALLSAQKHPLFKFYEEDGVMSIHQKYSCDNAATGAPSWGLSRISERDLKISNVYRQPNKRGVDVVAYIVDTGIYVDHEDFGGRASFGFKADNSWSNTDGNGHGTHVASTTGGTTYGVAKEVELVAVKVLSDGGSGSTAGVIAGVDWVTGQAKGKTKKVVANLSLGGGFSSALNAACNGAVDSGIFMAVAAGNDNGNACSYSPASATKVTTVGATDIQDRRSTFSNWGSCVDVFAPGTSITAAWIGSRTATRTISGTSMASPHICGIGALAFSENPNWTNEHVKKDIVDDATPNKINMGCTGTCGATINKLGFNGC
jgi:serine protease